MGARSAPITAGRHRTKQVAMAVATPLPTAAVVVVRLESFSTAWRAASALIITVSAPAPYITTTASDSVTRQEITLETSITYQIILIIILLATFSTQEADDLGAA